MSKFKVKSNKWYRWFWPPERKKIKIMQAIVDSKESEIEQATQKVVFDKLIYGFTEAEAEKWMEDETS